MGMEEESVEGMKKIREEEGLERKKGKKNITIKMPKNKDDSKNTVRGKKKS